MTLAQAVSPMNRGGGFIVALFLLLLAAIPRNPNDRVLPCQALALVSIIAAGLIISWAKWAGSTVILALIPSLPFAFLAGHLRLMNWVWHRNRAG